MFYIMTHGNGHIDFFTQSKLIESVLPQASQLGIHFSIFLHYTQLEMHLIKGPDKGNSTGEGKLEERLRKSKEDKGEDKSSAPGGIRTHDFQITRRVFCH